MAVEKISRKIKGGGTMRILIDINHPADVHQFKNVIKEMSRQGHKFRVIARDKECTHELLRQNKIKFVARPGYKGMMKLYGMARISQIIVREAKKFQPDVLVGSSGDLYIAQSSQLLGKPSIIFDDTEHSTIQNWLTFPFATKVVTPKSYTLDLGKKQIRYDGFKELAYLHPGYFKPNPKIHRLLRVKPNEPFILLRFVSWDASHDIGKNGISDKIAFVSKLASKFRVFISSESELPEAIRKYQLGRAKGQIHSVLHSARLVISEGGTTAAEAAILGTPTIYVNPLKMGYTNELIGKYGLLEQITEQGKILKRAESIMKNQGLRESWKKKRDKLVQDKVDTTKFYIKTIKEMAKRRSGK